MKTTTSKSSTIALSLLLIATLLLAGPNRSTWQATAQTPARKVRPLRAYPVRGFFRVTLNGFRVRNESDDDILEGDGRGDEIFITTSNWMVHKDGTSRL